MNAATVTMKSARAQRASRPSMRSVTNGLTQ